MQAPGRLRYLIVGAVLLAGCYDEVGGPAPTIFGRYSLRSVDGQTLPVIVSEAPNFKLEFMTGTILLNNDNTFTDSTQLRRTDGQIARIVIDVASGSFVRIGDIIDLTSTRGEHYSMTIAERTLTQTLAGSILVYRK